MYGSVQLLPGEATSLYSGELGISIQTNSSNGVRGQVILFNLISHKNTQILKDFRTN